jgi:hypothetical protein
LYWEEFWELVRVSANYTADEKNAEMKFNFMLHADQKAAGKWTDLPIPFPVEEDDEGQVRVSDMPDKGGISQIPQHLRGAVFKE